MEEKEKERERERERERGEQGKGGCQREIKKNIYINK